MLRWSEEVTCEFVKIYLSHECLWNRRHENFKIKNKKTAANRELIHEFKNSTGITLTEPELSIKIKSLRSTYSQELNKIKQRSTSGWTYKPTLRWFADWQKCMRKAEGNNDDDSTVMENDQYEGQERIWVSNAEDDNTSDLFKEDYNHITLKLEPEHGSQTALNSRTSKIKKINKNHSMDWNYRSSLDSRTETTEDEFDIYGKYIASQLRNMSLQKALKLQIEIQSLVSEARISDMEEINK